MIAFWRSILAVLCLRPDGVSFRPQEALGDLTRRVDTAVKTGPLEGPATTEGPPPSTEDFRPVHQDEAVLEAATRQLPPKAAQVLRDLEGAVQRIEAKLAQGQAIAANDPDLLAYKARAEELGRMLTPVDPKAARAMADEIRDAGGTRVLELLGEAADNPAQLQAVLKQLDEQGGSYLKLFKKMDGDTQQARLLELTAPAMSLQQKAEAIAQFADGITPAAQEKAMAALLASEAQPAGREALLRQLAGRQFDYARVVTELGDKGLQAQFQNSYLQLGDYEKLRAAGVTLGGNGAAPSPETAAARAAAARRGEADAAMLADARACPEADTGLAGRAAPTGTPDEVARGNQGLLAELRGRLADNKQLAEKLGVAAREIDGQIAGLDAATTRLLDRKRLLEGLRSQHDAPELRAALAGVERELGELRGVRETLAKEKLALVGAQGGLTRSNAALETRAQQAIKEAIGAVRQGVDAEVKAQVIDMAEGLLAENTAARQPLPQGAGYDERVAHLTRLGAQLEALGQEGQLLLETRDRAPTGKPPAPPDPQDEAAVAAYAARLKADKSVGAIKDGQLVERTTEAFLATADQVQAELTEVGKAINERAMDQSGETLAYNQASFALLGEHAEAFQRSAQTHRADDAIRANDAARELLPRLKTQIAANGERLHTLEQARDKALADLEGLVPPELIARLRKNELSEQERAELLAGLPGAKDLGKHVAALEAITTLRTVDNQITSLKETTGKLKEHQHSLAELKKTTTEALEGVRKQYNEYLAATGLPPIANVSHAEMKKGIEALATRMLGPTDKPRDVFGAATMMQINLAAEGRKTLLQQLIVPTLRDAFAYSGKELEGMDISLEGTRKAVSALRKELGLPDSAPPGELTPDEAKQIMAIMTPQGLQGEKSALVQRMLTRRMEMGSFGGGHADVIKGIFPRIAGPDGYVGLKEITAALEDPSLSHIQKRALLRLVTPRDEAGKLQPNNLFRYMAGEGQERFGLPGLQQGKELAAAADQHLNIENVRDMRARAKGLHEALDQDDWWSSPDKDKVFEMLEWRDKEHKIPMTQADISSLALEYRKQHPAATPGEDPKDLFTVLQSALSTRDKGRAMFATDSRTLQDRIEGFRPEAATRALINDSKARERLADPHGTLKHATAGQRQEAVREWDAIQDCDRQLREMGVDPAKITSADQAFFKAAADDPKAQALQALLQEREAHVQRIVELKTVTNSVRYLQQDIATCDSWKKCGSEGGWLTAAFDPGAYRDMKTGPIKQAGKDAMALYGRYQAAAEPSPGAARQDLAATREIVQLEARLARHPEQEAELLAKIDQEAAKLSPKAQLYREFVRATAQTQQLLDRTLAQERTANEDYIQRLEVAIKVTKTVAVVSATTVVTIATFGTGTAAVAAGGLGMSTVSAGGMAIAAGTLTGTAMGVGLDYEARAFGHQELGEDGKPIQDDDFLAHSLYGNFKSAFVTSLSTVTGLGFAKFGAQVGGFAQTAAEGTWLARQGGQLLIQAGVGGVTNVTLDTVGRLVEGQGPDAKRMAFAFFQGSLTAGLAGASHSIGAEIGIIRDAAVGVAGEYLYAKGVEHRAPSMDEMVQNAFQQVIVGGLSTGGNKFIEHMMVGATGKGMAQGAAVRELLASRAGQPTPHGPAPVVEPHATGTAEVPPTSSEGPRVGGAVAQRAADGPSIGARPMPGDPSFMRDLPSGMPVQVKPTPADAPQGNWRVQTKMRDGQYLAVQDGGLTRNNAAVDIVGRNPEVFGVDKQVNVKGPDGTVTQESILSIDPSTGQAMVGTDMGKGRKQFRIVPLADLLAANAGVQVRVKRSDGTIETHDLVGIAENGSVVTARGKYQQLSPRELLQTNPRLKVLTPRTEPLTVGELTNVRVMRGTADGLNVEEAGWKVRGVTEEGKIQVVKELENGQMMAKELTPRQFAELNTQLRITDPDAFVQGGGLDDLPRVAKGQHQDPRANAKVGILNAQGTEGRVAINRQHLDALADARLTELQASKPADVTRYRELLQAATPTERLMLRRALAAGYDMDQIQGLATDIAGLRTGDYRSLGITDPAWVGYLNSLTPDQRVLAMTTLEGHQQAFTTSCNPTSAQIVRAELDPIFAMHGRLYPEQLVAQQQRLLEAHGGVAVLKQPGASGGEGTQPAAMAQELNTSLGMKGLGLEYDARVTYPSTPRSRAEMVLQLEKALTNGPTELFVEWVDAAGNRQGAHAIAVLESRLRPDGGKEFLLHDPEHTGHTVWVSAKDLAAGNLGPTYPAAFRGELYGFLDVRKTAPARN